MAVRQQLIWVKDVFVMGRHDYHYRHEPILYGWKEGAAHFFGGGRAQDTVWEIPRPRRSESHPTMKPVELVARALKNSSRPGDLVYEPFAGSGTTIIAAEQTRRRCVALEIDPRYAQVTIERWQSFTGRRRRRSMAERRRHHDQMVARPGRRDKHKLIVANQTACAYAKADGQPCQMAPLRDRPYCFSHDPERAEEAAEARRLGGLRRRKEGTIAVAYDLPGLDSVAGIRRLLDIVVTDAVGLENGIARLRVLISTAVAATNLLKVGELEDRLASLEAAVKQRSTDPDLDDPIGL